jgi:hypothetical protein
MVAQFTQSQKKRMEEKEGERAKEQGKKGVRDEGRE